MSRGAGRIDYLTYVTVVEKDEEYAELVYIIYKPVVDPSSLTP